MDQSALRRGQLIWTERLSRRRVGLLFIGGCVSGLISACGGSRDLQPVASSGSPTGAAPAQILRPQATDAPASPPPAAAGPATTGLRGDLTIFAAASLTDAFQELDRRFEATSTTPRATLAFGGSSQLVAQLAQGARADLFASADPAQMRKAVENGSIVGDPRDFATNRLTIIVPKDNPAKIRGLADLARPGLKFITVIDGVPIGSYTQQVLQKASQDPSNGSDFVARVNANVATRAQDVRQAVAMITLGEGDASIVYTSDITPASAPALAAIPIPEAFNVIATYPIAVVKGAANPADAERFIAFVLSDVGQGILAAWGFGRAHH